MVYQHVKLPTKMLDCLVLFLVLIIMVQVQIQHIISIHLKIGIHLALFQQLQTVWMKHTFLLQRIFLIFPRQFLVARTEIYII